MQSLRLSKPVLLVSCVVCCSIPAECAILTSVSFDSLTNPEEITILGRDFGSQPGHVALVVDNTAVPLALLAPWSDETLTVDIPDLEPGTYLLAVRPLGEQPVFMDLSVPTGGDITGVAAGEGLTGGGDLGELALDVDFGGLGEAETAARSDHWHDPGEDLWLDAAGDTLTGSLVVTSGVKLEFADDRNYINGSIYGVNIAAKAEDSSDIDLSADDWITMDARGEIEISAIGDITLDSNADIELEADNIKFNGNVIHSSDRALKTDLRPVDGAEILEQVADLPVGEWVFRDDPEGQYHIGPMAQDFAERFGYGDDDKHISIIDAHGVLLVAVQELLHRIEELEERVGQLEGDE